MNTKQFFKRNAGTILSCVGGAGVIATSLLTVKATTKAVRLLDEAKQEKGEDLTKMEIVKTAGPVYISPIAFGVATISCIVGANILNKRAQASLIGAYTMLNTSYKEYADKVEELYGEGANQAVEEAIFEDKAENEDTKTQLFYDEYSKQYFESTLFQVQKAQYMLNRELVMGDCAYLNEWYRFLDIPEVENGWDLGWTTGACLDMYWQPWVDFKYADMVTDDGRECKSIIFHCEPIDDFENYS